MPASAAANGLLGEPILLPSHVPQELLVERAPASYQGVILSTLQPSPPSSTASRWQAALGTTSMSGICPKSKTNPLCVRSTATALPQMPPMNISQVLQVFLSPPKAIIWHGHPELLPLFQSRSQPSPTTSFSSSRGP